MLQKRQQFSEDPALDTDYFIYCLEAVEEIEAEELTETQKKMEQLAMDFGVASIYNTCDTIEGLKANLNTLVLEDHNFKDYEVIYLLL